MNELNVNYTDHKGKYIYCIRNDKGFGIRKGKGYKVVKVEENNGEYFYEISTEKFPNGIGFKAGSKSFMSVEESQAKLRELKLTRILGGSEDQLFYTDEELKFSIQYKDCTIYAYKHENDWIELDYDGAIYETYANLTISSPSVAEDFEKEYIKYKREKKLNRILNI